PVIRRSLSDNGYLSGFPESFSFLRMTCYDDKDKQDAIEGLNHQRHLYFSWYSYKGFLSDTLQVSSPADSAEHTPILMNVSSGSLDYLHHIIKTCRELGIRLIFTYAPEYKSLRQLRYSDSKQVFRLIYDTVRANNIPYLRHDSLSICTDPSLFRDVSHLNRKGADTYSIILATKLREIMNDSNINHWLRPGLR
ncbi:MAG TPA: hypothetical protein VK666_14340, partial [Chryseolinea sp.]|nr:hypothetical protein [Chryseolinea sp.]